jgi:poly(3-hydroxyalkanoate) synthetase
MNLVWSKLVHEYLMGAQTPMTALRAWNADATRMPARMHSEYLRRLYLHNDLAEGRYLAGNRTLSLADIKVPLFVVATERDHVSPWTSVYEIHRLARAPRDQRGGQDHIGERIVVHRVARHFSSRRATLSRVTGARSTPWPRN